MHRLFLLALAIASFVLAFFVLVVGTSAPGDTVLAAELAGLTFFAASFIP